MTIGNVTETLEMGEPISVAIGGIVSPSSFWVYPLPNLDAPEDQCINKVLQLEAVGPSFPVLNHHHSSQSKRV